MIQAGTGIRKFARKRRKNTNNTNNKPEGAARAVALIGELLFPDRCPVCDKPVLYADKKDGICRECRAKLPLIRGARCCRCGRGLGRREEEFCTDCKQRGKYHDYTKGLSLCVYDEIMREAVYRLKYGGRREYAKAFGKLMAERFGEVCKRAGVQGIVPVPLHPDREKKRGYNQAALIAEAFGEKTGILVYQNYVVRCKNTPPLKSMDRAARQNNLKKAFNIGQNDVKLKIIIVIDDIYTTGSTIDAVAKLLKENGVSSVYCMTLAIGEDI